MIPAPQPDHFSFTIIAAQRIGGHARLDASTMKWFRDLFGELSFSSHDSRGADARSLDKSVVEIMGHIRSSGYGAGAKEILRSSGGAQVAGGAGSSRTDRGSVGDGKADPWPPTPGAARPPANARPAPAGVDARVAGNVFDPVVAEIGYDDGGQVCAQSRGSPEALRGRRGPGDRPQRRRTSAARGGVGPELSSPSSYARLVAWADLELGIGRRCKQPVRCRVQASATRATSTIIRLGTLHNHRLWRNSSTRSGGR
jgi:hypothetical protein